MKTGVFFLNPLKEFEGQLYPGDVYAAHNLRQCAAFLDRIVVVARRRTDHSSRPDAPSLGSLGATLGLELPDYGAESHKLRSAVGQLLSRAFRRELLALVGSAAFVYAEGTSLEAYLAAYAGHRTGRRITLELLATTDFNVPYMTSRLGLAGAVAAAVGPAFFRYVRARAVAGLYVNQDLMRHFPVAGDYRAAISPVRLDPGLWAEPRLLSGPATRYLYVGHLEAVKKIDLILRALASANSRLPQGWRLTLAGAGPERGRLESLAHDLGLGSSVEFRGRLPRDESLFRLYQDAHLLLITSYTEGFCRVLGEAMAAGLPVLSTPVGAAPDLLEPIMVVPNWSVSAWADRVVQVVNSPPLLYLTALRNHKAAQDFSLQKVEMQRQRFFEEAIRISSQLHIAPAGGRAREILDGTSS